MNYNANPTIGNIGENGAASKSAFLVGIFGLYLFLSPFYLFDSGLPQIADLCFVLGFVLCFMAGFLNITQANSVSRSLFILNLFVVWTFAINFYTVYTLQDPLPLIYTAYYLFGCLFAVLVVNLLMAATDRQLSRLLLLMIVIALIQCAIVIGGLGRLWFGVREMGFFNNPNQYAYFGVLLAALITYFTLLTGRYRILSFVTLALLLLAIFLSGSRAGAAALFVQLVLFVLASQDMRRYLPFLAIVSGVVGLIFLPVILAYLQELFIFKSLFSSSGEVVLVQKSSDSLEGRGYSKIFEFPEYLAFGAGEGAGYRFGENEVHSTLGAVLFNYGLVGFFLFISAMFVAARQNFYLFVCVFSPTFLYGLTHNGSRQPILFALLAIVSIGALYEKRRSKTISGA